MYIKTATTILLATGVMLAQPVMAAGTLPAYTEPGVAKLHEDKGLSNVELAKKLANPVASLISLPIQTSYTQNWGPDDEGDQYLMNVQPVIPFSLNDDWNVISRTIVPIMRRMDIDPRHSNHQSGIGDVVQSIFFSPVKPVGGWIVGGGPVFLLPTGTNDLSADKWGAGPTGVALKQIEVGTGHMTYGGLTNHIWDFGGSDTVTDSISRTFVNPFLNYTTKDALSFVLMTESTYDWDSEEWEVPIFAEVIKMGSIGKQKVSYGGGVFYYADSFENGPEGFGFRLVFTMLFPK